MFNTIKDRMGAGKLLLCLAGPFLLMHSGPAQARQETGETRSRLVETYDLDLLSPAGRRELDRRLGRAASAVCTPSVGASLLFAECVREAKRTARPFSVDDCYGGMGKGRRECAMPDSYVLSAAPICTPDGNREIDVVSPALRESLSHRDR